MPGDAGHREDIQPDIYRALEVILRALQSYEVDIWNAGCMVNIKFGSELSNACYVQVWDVLEGEPFFAGHDA